jgi:hypothetical protein
VLGPPFASAESLAATLQALDGGGYRSDLDAVAWAALSAVMALMLKSMSADAGCGRFCHAHEGMSRWRRPGPESSADSKREQLIGRVAQLLRSRVLWPGQVP